MPDETAGPQGPPPTPSVERTMPDETVTPPRTPLVPSGSIVIAVGGDPSTLDPQYADDRNERAANDNVYEALLFADAETGEIVPGLAQAWKQTDDTTWRFTLREDVQFHNGEPFNAGAVVYSVERIIDPDFNSEQISFVETVTGARAVGEYVVDVLTTSPDPTLPARMTWMKIVPPMYAEENPDEFGESPVGTGPYRFVEWVRGHHVTLEANKGYWGGAPSIAEVWIRFMPEEAYRVASLIAGEADLITVLTPEGLATVEDSVYTDMAACISPPNLDEIYCLSRRLQWTPRLDGRIVVKDMILVE